jgi:hypothetical protein
MKDKEAKKQFMNVSKDSNETEMLYAEQVRLLYKNAPTSMVATLVNSLILTFILWEVISHTVLISWLACNFLLTLPRYMLVYRYNRASIKPHEANLWGTWLIIGIACIGIVWGSAGIFLFAVESIAHQVFLAFVLAGMVAGALVTFSVLKRAFLAYSLPALIPIMVRFFAQGDDIRIAMGGMTLLFTILVILSVLRMHTTIVSSLKLQFENTSLITSLTAAKESATKLNEELKSEITERKQAEELSKVCEQCTCKSDRFFFCRTYW